jgi:hypothetical protein
MKGGCTEGYNDYLFNTVRGKVPNQKMRNFDGL